MTQITAQVKKILHDYAGMPPGILTNLCRILMHGRLGGTGRMIILPVDQGFEHGPAESFMSNPPAYDPQYHIQLAIDGALNAYAAPLGMLEMVAEKYVGTIPLILKMNGANKLTHSEIEPNQALTASVDDALYLGCSAVGLTIYPGSNNNDEMIHVAAEIIHEAKSAGLPTVIWSYPRGFGIPKEAETAIDVVGYGVQIASVIGAHIIKVKIPNEVVFSKKVQERYNQHNVKISTIEERIAHIKQCAFNGKRIVVFSGGASKDLETLYAEARGIMNGGGNGSIIGRNTFQRPKNEAIAMLNKVIEIYS